MILVHICCAVDSHYFLQRLKENYPAKKIVGFFYDPNIHPYGEYRLRLLDVQKSCQKLEIELIEGEYDYKKWLDLVSGYESEPEKGARCDICFDRRLEVSAKKASELGSGFLTTTLLMSPKKSFEQLKKRGEEVCKKEAIEFIAPDFRQKGGTQEQFVTAKEQKLYHQDYCGCIYALGMQRDSQKKIADELFSPISAQILPNSIEEKLSLYNKRYEMEEKGINHKIVREKFLNYRLLYGYVQKDGSVLESYPLAYSTLKRKSTKFRIVDKVKDIYFTNREEIIIISLDYFNKIIGTNYKDIKNIIKSPPLFETELKARSKIIYNFFSLSPIIVLKNIDLNGAYQLRLNAHIYEDVREHLVTFS